MKNKTKYKTQEKMNEAFDRFCSRYNCINCPLSEENHCTFAWLELEDERFKTSKDMISALIEEVSDIEIGNKNTTRFRIEMFTKLLSHREEILKIWQAQDNEVTDEK